MAFDPQAKYGVTLDEWNALPRSKRVALKDRAKRLAKPDWYREQQRKRYQENKEKERLRARRYWIRFRAERLEYHHKRRATARSKQKINIHPDKVYLLIYRAANRSLPAHIRDDVISEMCLAVLEGKLLIEEIDKAARKYVTDYNRSNDVYKTVSFDKPFGSDGYTLGEAIGVY
ncbi:MAG: hypothetical protein WBA15_08975 [Mesorhizobium sp.]